MTQREFMRLIKSIIFLTILGYSILFCVDNFQATSLSIPFVANIESLPQFLVIIGSITAGIFIGSLIGTFRDILSFMDKKSVSKENKLLKKKIDMYETEKNIHRSIEAPDDN